MWSSGLPSTLVDGALWELDDEASHRLVKLSNCQMLWPWCDVQGLSTETFPSWGKVSPNLHEQKRQTCLPWNQILEGDTDPKLHVSVNQTTVRDKCCKLVAVIWTVIWLQCKFAFSYAFGSLDHSLHLRTYPPKFGMKVTRLHGRFCSKKEALPKSAFSEPVGDGLKLFSQLEWGDWWECANMKSVFLYLRGSNDLELGEWRDLFPTHV